MCTNFKSPQIGGGVALKESRGTNFLGGTWSMGTNSNPPQIEVGWPGESMGTNCLGRV